MTAAKACWVIVYRFLESIFPVAVGVEGLYRFVESVLTAGKLIARFGVSWTQF